MGHPRQLARLFSTEAWERFGFYGMRALLVLYLVNHFLLADHQASGIVGGFLSLVYLTPVVGGWLADHYLGSKRAVKFGAIVMAVGYFLLCFGGQQAQALRHHRRRSATRSSQQSSGSVLDPKTGPQTIVANGQNLTINGQSPTASVNLTAANGQVAKHRDQGRIFLGRRAIALLRRN